MALSGSQITALSPSGVMGRRYSFSAKGAATPATLNLRIRIGGVPVIVSGAVAVPSGASNVPWRFEGDFVVRAIGAGGSVVGTGLYDLGVSKGLIANVFVSTLDTDLSADIEVSAQWGTKSPSNIITAQQLLMERSG